MRHAGIGVWMFGGAIAALHAMAFAQQAGWKPVFVPPGAGATAQTAPLRIHVAGIPADTPQHLGVELDDIDVTSLAALDGSDIVITPAQPIAFGAHTLRLVEYTPDGGIAERGQWAFEIRQSAAFLQSQLRANVTLTASQRVANHNVDTSVGPLQGTGSAQIQGRVANETWQANGSMSLVSSSQTAQMPLQGSHLDIAQYLLSAQHGSVSASVGDHTALGPESLVMQNFARRGVTVDLAAGSAAHVTGFSMSATPLAGSRNLSGTQDDRNRIDGMVASLFPLPGRPEALALSGTYVDGESTGMSGAGVAGSPQPYGGHAGSLVADAQLFDKLLRLRGEAARSSYDFDGVGVGLEPQAGHAYSGLANYTPWHSLNVLGQPLVWNVGVQKKVLSTFFQSPATPGAIADRDMGQLFSGLNWYGLSAQAAAAKEHDNVDDLALVPRTRTTQHSFSLNWVPVQRAVAGTAPAMAWYGTPSLSASYVKVSKELTDNAGSFLLALGPLHETSNLMLGAQFQHASWSWGATHTRVEDQDFAGYTPQTVTTADRLQTAFLVKKLNVGASVEHDKTEDLTNVARSQAMIGGATLAYPFTRRVSSNLTYNVRHAWSDVPASDQITSDTTLGLNWVVVAANGQRPGLSLGLDGSYHSCRDKLASSSSFGAVCENSYQAFVRMSISWMPSF
ncbi:MAG TPA: hypothetical protein VLX30_14855 [Burkholderiales bacterium]|nr:hypothetical protein [Burkholderiales bacterium]